MKRRLTIFLSFLLFVFLLPTTIFAGTILASHYYAWSNNVGWISFKDTVVSDSALTGYAWSSTNGWIKMNPSNGGVANDGQGNLSGYAWGEGLGWINFSQHKVLRTKTKRRMMIKIGNDPKPASLASYVGMLKHGDAYNLKSELVNNYWINSSS